MTFVMAAEYVGGLVVRTTQYVYSRALEIIISSIIVVCYYIIIIVVVVVVY